LGKLRNINILMFCDIFEAEKGGDSKFMVQLGHESQGETVSGEISLLVDFVLLDSDRGGFQDSPRKDLHHLSNHKNY
jgi:hypothetical protein